MLAFKFLNLISAFILIPLSVSSSRIRTLPAESHSMMARMDAESGSTFIIVSRYDFSTYVVSLILCIIVCFLLAQLTLDRAIVRIRAFRNALDSQTEFRQFFTHCI